MAEKQSHFYRYLGNAHVQIKVVVYIAQKNYSEEKGHGDSSSHDASKPTKIM